MRTTHISCLLAAVCSATLVLADATSIVQPTPSIESLEVAPQPTSSPLLAEDAARLRIRQVAGQNLGATLGKQAAGAVTQYDILSGLGATGATEVPVVYTQLFSAVPDQWPSPGVGVIGLGSLGKRDVVAEDEGPAQAAYTGIAGRVSISR